MSVGTGARATSPTRNACALWAVVASIFLSGLIAGTPAFARGGIVEINQEIALAGGVTGDFLSDTPGFPVVLTQPGAYRLTGDLVVPNADRNPRSRQRREPRPEGLCDSRAPYMHGGTGLVWASLNRHRCRRSRFWERLHRRWDDNRDERFRYLRRWCPRE
jgi:hypothetical protein